MLLELEGLQYLQRGPKVARSRGDMRRLRQLIRRTHFFHDCRCELVGARGDAVQDRLQQPEAVLSRAGREAVRGGLGRRDRSVDVCGASQADAATGFFGCRVDDVQSARRRRIDPASVNVKLQELAHGNQPLSDGGNSFRAGVRRRLAILPLSAGGGNIRNHRVCPTAVRYW